MYSGAVLAGGASRRFGEDKALYPYRGRPLLGWVLESLAGAGERFIVANRPYAFGVPVYPDLIPGGDALSGLHSALYHARLPWVAVAACDLPFLTRGYWDYLYEKAQTASALAVVALGPEGDPEPLAALYHRDLLPQVETQLRTGDLLLRRVFEGRALFLPFAEIGERFGPQVFLNANTRGALP